MSVNYPNKVTVINNLSSVLSSSYAENADKLDGLQGSSYAVLSANNVFTNDQTISGNLNVTASATISGTLEFTQDSKITSVPFSSGDGGSSTTLELIPDKDLVGNDQYIVVDPTSPSHIHLRAGGAIDASNAYLFLGGEKANVQVSNIGAQDVKIHSSGTTTHEWLFDNNGKLHLAGDISGSMSNAELLSVTSSFYGNLNGTASYANNATSASYATNALSSSHAITASYALTAGSSPLKGGNMIVVDGVNGDDSTGVVNGLPFKTVNAAINYVSGSGLLYPTIWVMPNTYTLTSGITMPDGCALRGVSTQTTKLVLTSSNSDTTMITMGNNSRIEDMSLTLYSTSSTANLVGIKLPGSTGTNSKLRTAVLTVDNSSITASANTNVYGIWCSGSVSAAPSDFSFNYTRGVTLNVFSNGGGIKRGVYADTPVITTFRDTNIYVKAPTSALSTGSYVGVESANANCSLQFRTTSISGPSTSGSYTGSDILQTSPGTGFIDNGIQLGPGCDLINKTAGGKPFTTYVTPTTLDYSLHGNASSGTRYLWPGVQTTEDTTQVFYRFQQKSILQGLFINMRTAPDVGHSYQVNILKSTTGVAGSGVATAMSASVTGSDLTANNYTVSVDFSRGEYLAVQTIGSTPISAADVIIELDLF